MAEPEGRTFTEAEHLLLLTAAVNKETAEIASERESLATEKAELEQRIDVLEAEKAQAVAERDAVQAEFDEFKASLERAKEIAERTDSRVAQVKDLLGDLPYEYTPERAQRWAEMSDEEFAGFLADLPVPTKAAAGGDVKVRESAAFSGGTVPSASKAGSVSQLLAARRAVI